MRAIVTNKAGSTRTFKVNLYGRAMLYTGAQGQIVKRASDRLTLKKGESENMGGGGGGGGQREKDMRRQLKWRRIEGGKHM